MPAPGPSKSGSALLLTILVVGLLMVVSLAFVAFVRMELRAVAGAMEESLARKNALLGMDLALARLQETAGPDQRVTATAGILGSATHPANRFVTGVWDTRVPGAQTPQWLMSTPTASLPFQVGTAYPANQSTELLGRGTLGASADPLAIVRAPLRPIPNAANQTTGRYAFWVADEGVKASLSLLNPHDDTTVLDQMHESEIRRLRYAVPVRTRQEWVLGGTNDFDNPADPGTQAIRKLVDAAQFPLIDGLADPERGKGFHLFTQNARGLLTNPVGGGVKKDLSLAPNLLGNGFARFMDFPSYLQAPDPANFLVRDPADMRRLHRIVPPTNLDPSPGEIVHSVVPIITDFGLQFSPRRQSASNGTATLMMAILVEMWNPYSTGLVAEDLMLEISGYRPFRMELRASQDATAPVVWSNTFDPNQVFGDTVTLRLGREQLHTTTYLTGNAYDINAHGPGRLLYWAGPANSDPTKATFANRQISQSRQQGVITPQVTFPTFTGSGNLFTGYTMDPTSLTVVLRRAPENGGDILASFTGFQYEEVDSFDSGTLSFWQNRWLTYRFRMIERGTTYLSDRSAWMKHTDKRTPRPTLGDDITQDSHTLHEDAVSYSPDDAGLRNDLSVAQSQEIFYFDRILSNSAWSQDTRRDMSVFELPRQPLVSIGQLQHLHISGMPPYSIGNPWGGTTWNRLFDEYFLSGMQTGVSIPDLSAPNPAIPHPRLSLVEAEHLGLAQHTSAHLTGLGEHSSLAFSVNGQFNVNSIQPESWAALLGGALLHNLEHARRDTNLHDANHTTEGDLVTGDVNYPVGFPRFPQSLQELFEVDMEVMDRIFPVTPNPSIVPQNDRNIRTMKPAVNFLQPRTGFNGTASDYASSDTGLVFEFASALAEGVASRNAARGRPYFSLNEFITEDFRNGNPLLETLLRGDVDAGRFPRLASGEARALYVPVSGSLQRTTPDERSPAWLSQADILSALAPVLSTRSDTFVIRSHGDVLNPAGTQTARAWCEAVVQRVITPVAPTMSAAAMAANPANPWGRHFKLVSFRWLNESDL